MRARRFLPVLMLAASSAPLLFPGDAPFINDEPLLISAAFRANQAHHLVERGLTGTVGISYGPVPTWIYQLFLLLSHNLVHLVLIRALLVAGATALSLGWLARTLKLWPGFGIALLLSPYLWFYSRALWDNSFCIPLCALAFASYASFIDRGTRLSLSISLGSMWLLLAVHLMSLSLIVPIAAHMLLFGHRSIWRHKWVLLGVTLLAIACAAPYWSYLLTAPRLPHAFGGAQSWLFALMGPRFLSAQGLDYFFAPGWLYETGNLLVEIARCVTLLSFPLVWGGIGLSVYRIASVLRRRQTMGTFHHLSLVALAVILTQSLINGYTGTFAHPHYYNATWIIFAFFAWVAADEIHRLRFAAWIPWTYATALAAVVGFVIAQIHRSGGTRFDYGPTLANQVAIARQLNPYSADSVLRVEVACYQRFPHALETVRLLNPGDEGIEHPHRNLSIVYASSDPHDGRITAVEARQ